MHKNLAEVGNSTPGMQLSFFQLEDPVLCHVRDEILHVDINNLTPVEALNKLNEIKKIITGKDSYKQNHNNISYVVGIEIQ